MFKVVVGYDTFADMSLERGVLSALDVEMVTIKKWGSPEAIELAIQADALMLSVQPVQADLINRLEHCKLICRIGVGIDAIDIPAATARGIWVTNVPDYSIDEVSTHAIALLLTQARNMPKMLAMPHQNMWLSTEPVKPIRRLRDQTFGVLGFGRIGRATAAKARGLGMTVIASDPYVAPEVFAGDGVRAVDFSTLLSESDYLSLHTPLTPETRQIINAAALAKMKPSAYIINTARGPVVDQDALLEAVRAGKLLGAALDVLMTEPPAADTPILHDDRIMITPHNAWYSEESAIEVRRKGVEDVVRVLRGEHPRTPVNKLG